MDVHRQPTWIFMRIHAKFPERERERASPHAESNYYALNKQSYAEQQSADWLFLIFLLNKPSQSKVCFACKIGIYSLRRLPKQATDCATIKYTLSRMSWKIVFPTKVFPIKKILGFEDEDALNESVRK
jgi:hypothetical protein